MDSKEYWRNIDADKIIGRNRFPGEELFSVAEQGSFVLDLGCGTGEISEHLAERGYNVTGVDINVEAISQNCSRGSNVSYLALDITEKLPYEDSSFDVVVFAFVLVNILPSAAREALIKEVSRILKPRGVVWLNEPLVSKDYEERYFLSKPFVKEEFDTLSLKSGYSFDEIYSDEEMKKYVDDGCVARIFHHFTGEELRKLFEGYELLSEKLDETASPNTGTKMNMETLVFKKI